MKIYGELVGFQSLTSKKGTDCLFGWILQDFPTDSKDALGCKAVQIAAFGDDAGYIKSEIAKNKFLNKNVEVLGNWSNNTFNTLQISEWKR